MNRRKFLKSTIATSAAAMIPGVVIAEDTGAIDDLWRDYAAVQPMAENSETGMIFYVKASVREDSISEETRQLKISVENVAVTNEQLIYTESNIGSAIARTIKGFPKVECNNEFEIWKARNDVARKTKRGQANINYHNSWYYKGKSSVDAPFIVIENIIKGQKRYGIWTHPQYEQYGFEVI